METVTLITTLTIILLAVGWLIGGLIGMGIALLFAIVINGLSYWYSDRIVLRMYRAQPLDNERVSDMVQELAREAKLTVPQIYHIPQYIPNAFATGRGGKNSAIAITDGLLEQLDDAEIKGVLAHEMGHIKNRDILVGTLAATIAGAISYLAQIGYFSVFFGNSRNGGGGLFGLLLIIIFAPLAAFLIRMAISRKREYRADITGVSLTKEPHALASALRKISHFSRTHPLKGSTATSHMWIVNPFKHDWFTGMFSTHPPIEKRIEQLESIERGQF